MVLSRFRPPLISAVLHLLLHLSLPPCIAIRTFPKTTPAVLKSLFGFSEAPDYVNSADGAATPPPPGDPSPIHVVMTLDSEYLRGSIVAVHSVLRHASCPEQLSLHFIATEFDLVTPRVLTCLVHSIFPSLDFKVYILFREDWVINLIFASIRSALENPLNYARNYLGDILDPSVKWVIYIDSDLVLVDDITKLWEVKMNGQKIIGAPEYCHANFTKYFTDNFWSDPVLTRKFGSRIPCYFNTGVMVMDLEGWREGHFHKRIENWMELQRSKRIYDLGSLPPFLLMFGGNVEPINHRWNQHGLGDDNIAGSCRVLHPGPVSLLHWSGKRKLWVRLDEKRPYPLDHLWEPYDLYRKSVGMKGQDLQIVLSSSLAEYSSFIF